MRDQLLLSLLILVIGLAIVLPLVYWWSMRKPPKPQTQSRGHLRSGLDRREPVLAENDAGLLDLEPGQRSQIIEVDPLLPADETSLQQGELLNPPADENTSGEDASADDPQQHEDEVDTSPRPGVRPNQSFDRIVTLFVHARSGSVLRGSDLVVVAEKVGLIYGDMGIYHRMLDGKEVLGPVFSMANIAKPGNFDLRRLTDLETPGLSLFMTLPGPMSALDAWNSMLPVAQRVAQLLDAELLDETRNPLVEQTVSFLRNEMREYDREIERQNIRSHW